MLNSKNVATVAIVAIVLTLGAAGIVTTIAEMANALTKPGEHGPPDLSRLPPCIRNSDHEPPICRSF